MDNGWIKLHRQILLNPIAQKPHYLCLWILLLLKANHNKTKMIWNNDIVVIHEGQLVTGRKQLSKQSGIAESTIEDVLNFLERQHQIQQQKTTKYRLITILNWKQYQDDNRKSNNKATTKQQQADTNNNDKKIKNDKNTSETKVSQIVPLVIDLFKDINPAYKKWFGNKTQRKAVESLVEKVGFEQLAKVIALLPKINKMPYLPTITTPLQLEDKWASLEVGLTKLKLKNKESHVGLA